MAEWSLPCAGPRRVRWGQVIGGAGLAVWLLSVSPAPAHEPGRGPPSDTGPPASSSAAVLQPGPGPGVVRTAEIASSGEPDPWHTNLIRERQVEVRLRTALRDLEEGRLIAALTSLQSILDRDDDVFIRFASEPAPRGARFLADRLIGGLSPRSLTTYETLHGKEARRRLETALAGPDAELLARIVRRFSHAAPGFATGNRLAGYWTHP